MDAADIVDRLGQSGALQSLPGPLQTALFLGALAFLPAALVCLTGYTRIIIVLGFVRRAVTSQDIPPNLVLIGLAFFLTCFVMAPTFEQVMEKAVQPYLDGEIKGAAAAAETVAALKKFMVRQTRRQDLALFLHLSQTEAPETPDDVSLRVLVPAFVVSELKSAFIMGFCIYLPFLLVDLVVASVLTSMGMVMMPPVVISAPFKILLFVVADGWHLVLRALSVSFG
jgi:flagellar biosynthetic protein FliP